MSYDKKAEGYEELISIDTGVNYTHKIVNEYFEIHKNINIHKVFYFYLNLILMFGLLLSRLAPI